MAKWDRISEITYAKDKGTLNANMCEQGGIWEGSKNWS